MRDFLSGPSRTRPATGRLCVPQRAVPIVYNCAFCSAFVARPSFIVRSFPLRLLPGLLPGSRAVRLHLSPYA
jgi:hypothetical protein